MINFYTSICTNLIKLFSQKKNNNNNSKELTEKLIHAKLNHPNIVKILDFIVDKNKKTTYLI